jgi:hypothetical protein
MAGLRHGLLSLLLRWLKLLQHIVQYGQNGGNNGWRCATVGDRQNVMTGRIFSSAGSAQRMDSVSAFALVQFYARFSLAYTLVRHRAFCSGTGLMTGQIMLA